MISNDDYEEINRRSKVDHWDVLFTMIGTVGEPCLVSEEPNYAIKNIGLFKNKTEVRGKYLYYYLCSPEAQHHTKAHSRGTTQQYIPLGALRKFPIRYPEDENEMLAITNILGSLDDKIELNRRMNATLEGMAQALFKSWFVDFEPVIDNALEAGNPIPDEFAERAQTRRTLLRQGSGGQEALSDFPTPGTNVSNVRKNFPDSFQTSELGPIPTEWEIGKILDLFELHRGFDLSAKKRTAGSFPVYSAGGIHGMHNEYKMEPPGIITGRSGVIGNVYLSLTQYWPLNTTLYVRNFRKSGPFYALHFLKLLDLKVYNSGSAVPSLNRNHVHASDTVVPAATALKEFERFAESLYVKIKANIEASESLSKLRDTLLPKLISGELRVESLNGEG